MAQTAVSDEISSHFEAVLLLSKRQVLRRLLQEAEHCMRLELLATATRLAGIAIDEIYPLLDSMLLRQYEQSLTIWQELRNIAATATADSLPIGSETVARTLNELAAVLDKISESQNIQRGPEVSKIDFESIRGKYAFVPTSVNHFLKRKREDLDLEDRR